jgi:hypothetical protein
LEIVYRTVFAGILKNWLLARVAAIKQLYVDNELNFLQKMRMFKSDGAAIAIGKETAITALL